MSAIRRSNGPSAPASPPTKSAAAHDPTDALAEADPCCAVRLTPGVEADLVAILEEGPGLAAGKLDRPLAALADLEQGAETLLAVGGQGAGADQVARLEITAVRAVV